MAIAFGSYDEPHAWLLRGLVEYGWADLSLMRGQLPPGAFGGLDLSSWLDADGRDGIPLRVPAVSGGKACVEDGVYTVTVQLQRRQGGLAVVVRCAEANLFQEFPYDPYNPTWAAGYVHQALLAYVPQYVAWRLSGGELSWAQREGVPKVQGEPCSAGLLNFLRGRMRAHQALDQLLAEGWAVGRPGQMGASGARLPNVVGGAPAGGGSITAGLGGADPSYLSAAARAALARGESPAGGPANRGVQAQARVAGPANALMTTAALAAVQSIFWLIDSLTVVLYYPDSASALLVSIPMFLILLPVSVGAAMGAHQMKQLREGPLPWLSIATAALTPVCCVFGLPAALWAYRAWTDPDVVAMRVRTDQQGPPPPRGGQRMSGPVAGPTKANAARDTIGKLHEMTKKLPF